MGWQDGQVRVIVARVHHRSDAFEETVVSITNKLTV